MSIEVWFIGLSNFNISSMLVVKYVLCESGLESLFLIYLMCS
jgi:hypothetical protein